MNADDTCRQLSRTTGALTAVQYLPSVDLLPRSSPVAASVEDPRLGSSSVFPPVASCLSSVTLVIYVTHVKELEKTIGVYKKMYGPHMGAIEFYVDGTWCDPNGTNRPGMPCTGGKLER